MKKDNTHTLFSKRVEAFMVCEKDRQTDRGRQRHIAILTHNFLFSWTCHTVLSSRPHWGTSSASQPRGTQLEARCGPLPQRNALRDCKLAQTQDSHWFQLTETISLIVYTWNSSPLRSNLLRLQCTCSTVPTNSGRPHGSPLVWACQWPSSQPLSSQLSHNDSLWA